MLPLRCLAGRLAPAPGPAAGSDDLLVRVPAGLRATPGARVLVPLLLSGCADGRGIRSWSAAIGFDPAVLRLAGVRAENCLSAGWAVEADAGAPGLLRLEAAGQLDLVGDGPLLLLAFEVTGAPGARTDLALRAFRFNAGRPAATLRSGDLSVAAPLLGGLVRYARSAVPVERALLSLREGAGAEQRAATGADGAYRFSVAAQGHASVTLSKSGDLRGCLSALDAAWIAQHAAGLRSFTPEQRAAGDVGGVGTCGASDAALLAAFLVGAPQPESQAGTWRFTPPSRDYALLDQDALDEHYTGYIVGDVTGNWGSSRPQHSADIRAGRFGLGAAATALLVQVAHASVPAQGRISLPLLVGPLDEQGILGYALTISYDPAVLDIPTVSRQSSLSADWSVVAHQPGPGHLNIVAYGLRSLRGGGSLLNLDVLVRGPLGATSPVALERVLLNEGQPPAQARAGRITVGQGPPLIELPLSLP